MYEEIKKNMALRNKDIKEFATKDSEAYRFKDETDNDFRTPYYRDADRIVYSLSYTRYMDKTQVFSLYDNDNISKRMTHVQMVSKIARTLGRALRLNEDLIEAAALGHDIGHVPFGHTGERILNKISLENNEGYFNHNIQSVRTLMNLEKNGKGLNLTLQVLDGIMCHNGELELKEYRPKKKTKEEFLEEYEKSYKDPNIIYQLVPMTIEGCVVRISDIIAYIGRDVEDAIRMGVITMDEVPKEIVDVLGTRNTEIINTINVDLLEHSMNKDYICMSDEVFNAIRSLKKFNNEHIYSKANTKEQIDYYEKVFRTVFDHCLEDVKNNDTESRIFKVFLNDMIDEYKDNTSDARKVIDYIAGMTDDFIIKEYNTIIGKE
ncbi:MAG: dNTP triphosphohydrolase [Bacilli bacterium]|nr:dNTP triphosphohydrolase [Bacilli bacterium]